MKTQKKTVPLSLIDIWSKKENVINGWIGINSPVSAEFLAKLDWDAVTVDTQHGLIDLGQAISIIQSIASTNKITLCRVPWNDPVWIMKLLDAGASGIICPMINTREQCEEFVSACRYSPAGNRSWGPVRIPFANPLDYLEWANSHIATIAMIETQEAFNNLDDILKTDGLNAVYVGPSDLALSLGEKPDVLARSSKVRSVMAQIKEKAENHGIAPCLHTGSGEMAKEFLDDGWRLATILNDLRLMVNGANDAIKIARS